MRLLNHKRVIINGPNNSAGFGLQAL
ncbi:conserved hypothetical protein [Acidithiobacillus ferrivorans]|uniref:Uncharacterized protein n=1 Tax=Acidithiobacillus ferrivorans TaxID=160808 RepID=A0A060UTR6_9PROT|nr:conserved hypothetical protein [Acidithiobacillus ferrivorans]